ncbi:MAG: hypothetical protein CVT47_03435 [Thermoplasmata archaeon HGW-Thermoplasmata-2]|nr:MAG: hypothetical protein CVT47_03435 [Thermoplasmata archaeon HGW-Thermoplasmata-2]
MVRIYLRPNGRKHPALSVLAPPSAALDSERLSRRSRTDSARIYCRIISRIQKYTKVKGTRYK